MGRLPGTGTLGLPIGPGKRYNADVQPYVAYAKNVNSAPANSSESDGTVPLGGTDGSYMHPSISPAAG